MKRKSRFLTVAAALAAGAFGLGSSPSGQQVMNQMYPEGSVVTQQAPQRYVNNGQQQAQNQTQQQQSPIRYVNPYTPYGGGYSVIGGYSLSPKEYGEYLMRTGKDKQNKRRRKHWSKMCS